MVKVEIEQLITDHQQQVKLFNISIDILKMLFDEVTVNSVYDSITHIKCVQKEL